MSYNLYEVRMRNLLKIKIAIQKLEQQQKNKRNEWQESGREVKKLSKLISEKKQKLMEGIEL